MEVVFSDNVIEMLESYKDSLKHYPISRKRALEKFDNMLLSLKSISRKSDTHLCAHKDLGQSFRKDGSIIHTGLRRFNYKDKSGFQWAFACLCNEKSNRITIVKMMPASRVIKEEFSQYRESLLGLWDRMERLPKRQFIH